MAKLSQMLGSLGEAPPPPDPAPPAAPGPAPGKEMGDLAQLLPLLTSCSETNTPDACLLRALKPYLHGQRAQRLDGALRLVQLAQLLPLLQPGKESSLHG